MAGSVSPLSSPGLSIALMAGRCDGGPAADHKCHCAVKKRGGASDLRHLLCLTRQKRRSPSQKSRPTRRPVPEAERSLAKAKLHALLAS